MKERDSSGLRITPGDAARSHESVIHDRGRAFPGRIEGGTSAKKSEAEALSSVIRSPYGMKISARVGRPFTLEEERTSPGERRPAEEAVSEVKTVLVNRDVALGARQRPTALDGNPNSRSPGGPDDAPRLEGRNLPEEPGRMHEGVARLKALLPTGWFKS